MFNALSEPIGQLEDVMELVAVEHADGQDVLAVKAMVNKVAELNISGGPVQVDRGDSRQETVTVELPIHIGADTAQGRHGTRRQDFPG